jgi:hypothetical protein
MRNSARNMLSCRRFSLLRFLIRCNSYGLLAGIAYFGHV